MKLLQQVLHPWTVIGALVIGLLLIAAAFGILNRGRPEPLDAVNPTAEIRAIDPPTLTPIVVTPPEATPTATLEIPPPPPAGMITLGAVVQIAGTGGEGLNLRDTAGLESRVQYLGFESEVFTVEDGPVEVDGLNWWYIVGFSDPSRSGWAAANFLEIVQSP